MDLAAAVFASNPDFMVFRTSAIIAGSQMVDGYLIAHVSS
jgi:hypothetical protein